MKFHGSYGIKFTTKLFPPYKRPIIQCSECNKSFLKDTELKRHLVSHKEKLEFKCNDCGKRFRKMKKLKIHMQCHVSSRQFTCPKYKETFVLKKAMEDRLAAYSVENSVEMTNCYRCGKIFAQGKTILEHMISHILGNTQ